MRIGDIEYPRLRCRVGRKGARRFYFDRGGNPRRWEPLGSNEARAIARWRELMAEPKPTPGTVDQMLADAIEDLRSTVKPATLANYRGYRKWLAATFDPDPTTITQADVLRYLRLCPRMSFKNEIGLLSHAFTVWMDAGRLTFNPCFGVKIKRKGSKRDRIFTPAELDAIIGKAEERVAVAIELAYATGLRISDCIALRWADIADIVETQKTGVRQAYKQEEALTVILARARVLQARVASLYVLCDRRGRQWTDDMLRKRWNAACKAAGVKDAHFHDVRATAITAVERLYGQEEARRFAGHKDIRTTIGYLRDKRPNVVRPLARKA